MQSPLVNELCQLVNSKQTENGFRKLKTFTGESKLFDERKSSLDATGAKRLAFLIKVFRQITLQILQNLPAPKSAFIKEVRDEIRLLLSRVENLAEQVHKAEIAKMFRDLSLAAESTGDYPLALECHCMSTRLMYKLAQNQSFSSWIKLKENVARKLGHVPDYLTKSVWTAALNCKFDADATDWFYVLRNELRAAKRMRPKYVAAEICRPIIDDMLTLSKDTITEQAEALIELAYLLNATDDFDDRSRKKPQEYCETALRLLEKAGNSHGKQHTWMVSILRCNANICIYLSSLQELIHEATIPPSPLDASADLFDTAPASRDIPTKNFEILQPTLFQRTFQSTRSIADSILKTFLEDVMANYDDMATDVSMKKFVVDLAQNVVASAAEILMWLWEKTKVVEYLYYICLLLTYNGYPKTATRIIDGTSAMEKLGQEPSVVASFYYAKILGICGGDRPSEESQLRDQAQKVKSELPTKSSMTYRLVALENFVDYHIMQCSASSIENTQASTEATRKCRRHMASIFNWHAKQNDDDLLDSGDILRYVDTVSNFRALLCEGLHCQRVGNPVKAKMYLWEGFCTAMDMCNAYWMLKFTGYLAQLRVLVKNDDYFPGDSMNFVHKIFFTGENCGFMNDCAVEVDSVDCVAVVEAKATRTKKVTRKTRATAEKARDVCSSSGLGPMGHTGDNISSPIRNGLKNSYSKRAMDRICRCDALSFELLRFEAIFEKLSAEPTEKSNSFLDILIRLCMPDQKSFICSACRRSTFKMDSADCSLVNLEFSCDLFDTYFLLISAGSHRMKNVSEELAQLENLLQKLPRNSCRLLFCNYFQTIFSFWSCALKISQAMDTDFITRMNNLQVSTTKNRGRKGKNTATTIENLEKIVGECAKILIDDLEWNGCRFYFPWYRLARQLVAQLCLYRRSLDSSVPLGVLRGTNNQEWTNLAAGNLLESSSISLRQTLLTGEKPFSDVISDAIIDHSKLESALKTIPKDWTVFSLHLTVDSQFSQRLIGCRLSSRGHPVVMDFGDVVRQFDAISIFDKFAVDVSASIKEMVKQKFWTGRKALEDKLTILTEQLESEWFGDKRTFFNRSVGSDFQEEILSIANGLTNDAERRKFLIDCGIDPSISNAISSPTAMTNTGGPVILILDSPLHCIPWELLPIFRDHAVTRMPSLHFLLGAVQKNPPPKTVDGDSVFYIVNPSGDLKATQEQFRWFSQYKKWTGRAGTTVSFEEMRAKWSEKDIYIYCGHNSGVDSLRYLSEMEQIHCRSTALLMGCSSGKLFNWGTLFERTGVPFSCLLAESPCTVANLWNVTDRDIDKFLTEILRLWLRAAPADQTGSTKIDVTQSKRSLSECIAQARKVCKLPFLTGGAVVAYGLPVYCDKYPSI